MNSPHKGPATRKMFPFDDAIMLRENIWRLYCISEFSRRLWTVIEKPCKAVQKRNLLNGVYTAHGLPCKNWWKVIVVHEYTGSCLNIKAIFYRYGDSHVKDNTVARPSYLQHGDPYPGRTTSLYYDARHLYIVTLPDLCTDLFPIFLLYFVVWIDLNKIMCSIKTVVNFVRILTTLCVILCTKMKNSK